VARSTTNTSKAKQPALAADPEAASAMSFEHAMAALEAITDRIESGEIGLEQSMAEYERGMRLIARCREVLDTAEQRVAELSPPPTTSAGRDTRS
jgi:exodeoxyribonuclease VII small subunit